MKVIENKESQLKRLREICDDKGVDFESIKLLLEAVKTKKLIKRNNHLQTTITNEIEKAIK